MFSLAGLLAGLSFGAPYLLYAPDRPAGDLLAAAGDAAGAQAASCFRRCACCSA